MCEEVGYSLYQEYCSAGDPATYCLHGGDEGAAGDHRHQRKQDWSYECK